jgi:hypothetical protein
MIRDERARERPLTYCTPMLYSHVIPTHYTHMLYPHVILTRYTHTLYSHIIRSAIHRRRTFVGALIITFVRPQWVRYVCGGCHTALGSVLGVLGNRALVGGGGGSSEGSVRRSLITTVRITTTTSCYRWSMLMGSSNGVLPVQQFTALLALTSAASHCTARTSAAIHCTATHQVCTPIRIGYRRTVLLVQPAYSSGIPLELRFGERAEVSVALQRKRKMRGQEEGKEEEGGGGGGGGGR